MSMGKSNWGHCKDCRWWQIEPDAGIENHTMGHCIQDALLPYQVRVAGISGCNHFEAGEPVRAEGASAEPSTAPVNP